MTGKKGAAMTEGTVLITGAGRRIGRDIALDLGTGAAARPVAVHCHRSRDAAEEVARAITGGGGRAHVVQGDLGDEARVLPLVDAAAAALGPVTCLINNASVFEHDDPATVTRESWDRHMEANLRAPFVLGQAMVRQLPDGAAGNIVNIIDQRVWNLTGGFTSYTLSKYGLWGLTQMLARGLAPTVRVNAIGPGPTLPSPRQTEESFRAQWESMPLKHPVDPAEICRAVRFILDAEAMTGQMIALDSGQHMGWAPSGGGDVEE